MVIGVMKKRMNYFNLSVDKSLRVSIKKEKKLTELFQVVKNSFNEKSKENKVEKVMKNDVKQLYSIRLKPSLLNKLKDFAEQYNLKLFELIRKILIEVTDSEIDKTNTKDILGAKKFKEYQKLPTELDKIRFLKRTMEIGKLNSKSVSDTLSSRENFFEKSIELLVYQEHQIENEMEKREKKRDKMINGK